MDSSASRSGGRYEPRGDVRFLSRLILEAMPRRSVERRGDEAPGDSHHDRQEGA